MHHPTQTILGYCELIDVFPEKKDEYINTIKRNSERLYKLTQDILEVAKIESNSLKLNIEKIELNEIINETIIDFISRPLSINNKDVKINFNSYTNHHHTHLPLFVYADKNRIQQVIFNLLDNASKFTDKGEITILSCVSLYNLSEFLFIVFMYSSFFSGNTSISSQYPRIVCVGVLSS